jgi:hypothetical protein
MITDILSIVKTNKVFPDHMSKIVSKIQCSKNKDVKQKDIINYLEI